MNTIAVINLKLYRSTVSQFTITETTTKNRHNLKVRCFICYLEMKISTSLVIVITVVLAAIDFGYSRQPPALITNILKTIRVVGK